MFGLLAGIPAIVCGHIARRQIRERGEQGAQAALIGLIFTFRSLASGAPLLMAIAIMVLELFVALLQAYIFTLLSSVFIGLIREGGH